ncbi:MAG: signal transduction histidine kinase, LytS [Bacteroidetes bacterium]|nr:signal transduction histidine kinase, LytS [Bacteroidota bacterium]
MKIKSKNTIKPIIHVLTWCMLFIFPIFIAGKEATNDSNTLAHDWLPLIEAGIIFYLNYLFLVEKFLFIKKQYAVFIIINIIIIILFRLDMQIFHLLSGQNLHDGHDPAHEGKHSNEGFSLIKSILALVIPALFAVAAKGSELWRKFETEKTETENRHLQSELNNLKYQLQPHFFFNSLNNIYSLVEISPKMAQQAIHNLSKLMRYLLYETNNEKVDLAVEINFLKKYIQLMEIRQSDDIVTNYNFPDIKAGNYAIAPLLLIPVIENAYKHGVSATEKSGINFDITLADKFTFTSSNTNYPKNGTDTSGSGIGLENLKKRLQLIYPNKHWLTMEIKENIFRLTLTIDLEKVKHQ